MRTVLKALLLKRKFTLLAVVGALTLLTATTALAGSGVGGVFNLGNTNTVNAITKLVGSVPGASLVIDNNSTNSAATALNLQVEPGKTPMKVNSGAKVANLNADKLDGRDSASFGRVLAAGSTTVDLFTVPGNSCDYELVDPSGATQVDISNDVVLVSPDGTNLGGSQWSVVSQHSNLLEFFRIQFCNQTAGALDPPSTRVNWMVFDR